MNRYFEITPVLARTEGTQRSASHELVTICATPRVDENTAEQERLRFDTATASPSGRNTC
jgi:hypothetical protein